QNYPILFGQVIWPEAKRNRLDPYFVLALIKQESSFKERAVSRSGAMGLMQIIPQTALRLAAATRQKDFAWEKMFAPGRNVKLGTFYLKSLSQLFDGQLPLMIAAYNAGEEAVSRWQVLRKKDSLLFFIEEIPYDQTQNYVQKVLANHWIYFWLYKGKLPASLISSLDAKQLEQGIHEAGQGGRQRDR
ncbi:MAG: lytic transglycosylase domain-containing protein, partial [Deltaproteobacteria bacterium]|nr:lytic transglycosylase domain-containing protein [Deltaproteobacteria bacterium]